jgi:hypothetical protein
VATRCDGARWGPRQREGRWRLRLAPREVRAGPNQEMVADWRVSPWGGGGR